MNTKKISIKSCVTEAVDVTDPTILNIMPTLMRWGVRADQKIGSYSNYITKIGILTVSNCKADIPCDAVLIKHILLGDYGCDCDLFNSNNLLVNTDEFDISQGDLVYTHAYYWSDLYGVCISDIPWSIEGDCIKLDTNYDGTDITVQYLAYETDDEGYPVVNESHRDAIKYYIMTQLDEREEWALKRKGQLNNAFFSSAERIIRKYKKAVRYARAQDGEPSETQKWEIAELINNPLTGYGNYMLENLRG